MNFAAIVFLAYLAISSGSSSSAWSGSSNYPSRNNYGDGEACDSCKRINDLTTIAEENANQTRKALQIMEQRMNSFEKTLINYTETLTNIEQILNDMRIISNYTNNLETGDKENATSTLIPKSSSTQVKESLTTSPSPAITKAKGPITFDSVIKGYNVQLSSDLRTAMRTRPTESSGYAGVVSNSILEEDQVYQIRIDEMIEKWSEYGIAIGVIEEKQERIKDVKMIFWNSNIKGTWAIYSWSESQSGKSTTHKDGNRITSNGYPLSTKHLTVGTILGVSRRSDGNVHFYLNGVDKGAAFRNVPKHVYAFVDLLHYVTKISIMN